MKVYKRNLPDGVKSAFAYDRGVKVKIVNKKMVDQKNREKKTKEFKIKIELFFCYSKVLVPSL